MTTATSTFARLCRRPTARCSTASPPGLPPLRLSRQCRIGATTRFPTSPRRTPLPPIPRGCRRALRPRRFAPARVDGRHRALHARHRFRRAASFGQPARNCRSLSSACRVRVPAWLSRSPPATRTSLAAASGEDIFHHCRGTARAQPRPAVRRMGHGSSLAQLADRHIGRFASSCGGHGLAGDRQDARTIFFISGSSRCYSRRRASFFAGAICAITACPAIFQRFGEGNAFAYDLADCGTGAIEIERLAEHWRAGIAAVDADR